MFLALLLRKNATGEAVLCQRGVLESRDAHSSAAERSRCHDVARTKEENEERGCRREREKAADVEVGDHMSSCLAREHSLGRFSSIIVDHSEPQQHSEESRNAGRRITDGTIIST